MVWKEKDKHVREVTMIRFALFRAVLFALPFVAGAAFSQDAGSLEDPPYRPALVPFQTDEGAQFQDRLSDARRLPEWFLGIYSGQTLSSFYYVASGLCEVMKGSFEIHRIHCAALRSEGPGEKRSSDE